MNKEVEKIEAKIAFLKEKEARLKEISAETSQHGAAISMLLEETERIQKEVADVV